MALDSRAAGRAGRQDRGNGSKDASKTRREGLAGEAKGCGQGLHRTGRIKKSVRQKSPVAQINF